MNMIGKIVGVSGQSVMQWIKMFHENIIVPLREG